MNPDFKDLFKALNAASVEYLVVGAHAVIYHGQPRYTKDLDVWVNPAIENAVRVYRALSEFGAPLIDVTVETFTDRTLVYQIGVEPNRIDILMDVGGVEFAAAWPGRVDSDYDGVPIHIIGKAELIRAKRAVGRARDLLDLETLEQ